MPYTPTQGIFVNGRVADATEILNEFGAIAGSIKEVEDSVVEVKQAVAKETDAKLSSALSTLNIDGGTF